MTGPTADAVAHEMILSPRLAKLGIELPVFPEAEARGAGPVRSLHLNEAPLPPSLAAIAAMRASAATMHRYPDNTGRALVAALAERTGVALDRIVLGTGSNELLFVSAEILLVPGDEAISPVPGFPSYAKSIVLKGARHVAVPVRSDGRIDVPAILAATGPRTRLVFVASPHNPTGGLMMGDEVERIAAEIPAHALLHFDEAYHEFGRHAGGPDVLAILARRRGPWIITRSFSKAYGLAGLRVGYAIASSRDLADAYRKVRPTFMVNAVALAGACAALDDQAFVASLLDHTAGERARLAAALHRLGFQPLPSAANFVTAIAPGPAESLAERMAARLREENIFVQPLAWPGGSGALRIAIGTAEDTDAVIDALTRAIAAP